MADKSAFRVMCNVLVWASGLAVASFLYSLGICGECTAGYFMALAMALFVFGVSVLHGVVTYLE